MMKINSGSIRAWLAALAALLTVILAHAMIRKADQEMRDDLLSRVQLLGQTLEVEKLAALTGSPEDLGRSQYTQLKRRLRAFIGTFPDCRFVYLMGRRESGEVFFLVDAEPPESKDSTSPGTAYSDASPELIALFDGGSPFVEEPLADEWGIWISALTPVHGTHGDVAAVLGADVAAMNWQWRVLARAAIPVGLITLLFVGAIAVLVVSRGRPVTPKPALRRLFPPLTILLALLPVGGTILLLHQYRSFMGARIDEMNAVALKELQVDLQNQEMVLRATLNGIAFDSLLPHALRRGNRDELSKKWKPLYEILRREDNLDFFAFYDRDLRCLLRFHNPDAYGDQATRHTFFESKRTGNVASGLELDSQGIFRLLATKPLFDGNELTGYIELGKGIEDILDLRHDEAKIHLAVTVDKSYLNRSDWEAGMQQRLSKEPDWERLPGSVVVYTSRLELPDTFLAAIKHEPESFGVHHRKMREDISYDGKFWRLSTFPLKDAAGRNVASLLLIVDVTTARRGFNEILMIGGVAVAVLLVALLTFVFILLQRTDAGILAQQAELWQRGELLAATLLSIGDGVIRTDTKGKAVALNRTAENLTGWSTAEAADKPVEDIFRIVNAKTGKPTENPVVSALSSGETVSLANHTVLIARDGSEHQIADSCSPILDEAGKIMGAVLVFRDVTEEYRRREQLRESEARFNQLAEHSRTVVWEVDANGLYTYVSRVAEKVFGYRPEELVNRLHFYDLHPEDGREEFRRMAFETLTHRESFVDLINPMCDKNGEIVWVATNGIAMTNEDGSLRGYRGSDTDITLRKQSEEMLTNALKQAKIAADAKSRFMANMNHELRTPMNGIIGMTELLATTKLGKEQAQYVEMLSQSGEHMLKVVNDVLDISAIEAGKIHLVSEPVNPRDLLEATLRPLSIAARKKGIEFDIVVAPDVPGNLLGDAGRLGQIITNLVANAVKFTEIGGVTVACSLFEQDATGARIQFTVEDTGIGIPETERERLFEPFFQVDSSDNRKYGGSGLGLSICRQLAEMMNGDIEATSTVGKGTTFSLTVYLLFDSMS